MAFDAVKYSSETVIVNLHVPLLTDQFSKYLRNSLGFPFLVLQSTWDCRLQPVVILVKILVVQIVFTTLAIELQLVRIQLSISEQ